MCKKILILFMVTSCCVFSPYTAYAYRLPQLHPEMLPDDRDPEPEVSMRKQKRCVFQKLESRNTGTPGYISLLGINRLWHLSTGTGQKIGIISSGVTPTPRISVIGAGDFVEPSSQGLVDCDGQGTLAASIIAAKPSTTDQFIGIAPHATIVSIRMFSGSYSFQEGADRKGVEISPVLNPNGTSSARMVRYLARAIVHLANTGVQTILSPSICVPAAYAPDLGPLYAAVHYAIRVKGIVIVAASSPDLPTLHAAKCNDNPSASYSNPNDKRNWGGVVSLSLPSMFPGVLSVGWATSKGELFNAKSDDERSMGEKISLTGPWVRVTAPGTNVVGIGIHGELVDSFLDQDTFVSIKGPYYSAAVVAGAVALLRARHPLMTVDQVLGSLSTTAHNIGYVDNSTGYGLIDPLAASFQFESGYPSQETNSHAISAFNTIIAPSDFPKFLALLSSFVLILTLFFVSTWYSMLRKEKRSHGNTF